MSAEHIALINPGKPVTVEMATSAMAHIKPGVTNFSHFYLPQNLDGKNGVYPDFPKGTDVYVVGDLHGDFDLLVNLLTKVMKVAKRNPDGTFDWIRANSWVVCVGDMVDRKRAGARLKNGTVLPGSYELPDGGTMGEGLDDIGQIQDLLNVLTLKGELEGRNNKVIKLLGNHDIIVTAPPSTPNRQTFMKNYATIKAKQAYMDFYDGLSVEDRQLFSPDYSTYCSTELAKKILSGNTAVICNIGRWFYTHGGIISLTVDRIKAECFPDGAPPGQAMLVKLNRHICSSIYNYTEDVKKMDAIAGDACYTFMKSDTGIDDQQSPLWLRKLGMCGSASNPDVDHICEDVNGALKSLKEILDPNDNNVHIVVAHCPQYQVKYDKNYDKVYSFTESVPYINDSDRLIYKSPGVNVSNNKFDSHGITYTCTKNLSPKVGGKVWRIDCAMSRAFDMEASYSMDATLGYKYFRARRPQCMVIRIKSNGEYETKVIVGKEGLDRSQYFAQKGRLYDLPVSYDTKHEKTPTPESLSRQLSLPEGVIDYNMQFVGTSSKSAGAAGKKAMQAIAKHHDELDAAEDMFMFPSVASESLNNNLGMYNSQFASSGSKKKNNKTRANSPISKKAKGKQRASSPGWERANSPPSPSSISSAQITPAAAASGKRPSSPGWERAESPEPPANTPPKPTPRHSRKNSGGRAGFEGAGGHVSPPKAASRKATTFGAFKPVNSVTAAPMNTTGPNNNMGFEVVDDFNNKTSVLAKRVERRNQRAKNAQKTITYKATSAASAAAKSAASAASSLYKGAEAWWYGSGKK